MRYKKAHLWDKRFNKYFINFSQNSPVIFIKKPLNFYEIFAKIFTKFVLSGFNKYAPS